jgi:helicase
MPDGETMSFADQVSALADRVLRSQSFIEDDRRLVSLRRKAEIIGLDDADLGQLDNHSVLLQRYMSAAYLLELAGLKILEADGKADAAEGFFRRAAGLYETISELATALPRDYRDRMYLHASLCYTLGGLAPNSQVLASKLLDAIPDEVPTLSQVTDFFRAADQAVLLFLRRRLNTALALIDRLLTNVDAIEEIAARGVDRDELSDGEIASLAAYLSVLRALQNLGRFLTEGTGDERSLTLVLNRIRDAAGVFTEVRNADAAHKARLLHFTARRIHEAATWRQLRFFRTHERQRQYLSQLIVSECPIVELWKSQIDALGQGLLDPVKARMVISMPTGAGKTRIAELAILQALTWPQNLSCIYVVPTRALVAQVEHDLTVNLGLLGYRVSSVAGTYELSDMERFVLNTCDVLVTTPEKLSLLIRRGEEIIERAGLFVFDEGHNVAQRDRGLTLELTVVEVKRKCPDARILLLSAVMPDKANVAQIANWLADGQGDVISVDWRPTRLEKAYFDWVGDQGMVFYLDESQRPAHEVEVFQRDDLDRRTNIAVVARLAVRYLSRGTALVVALQKRWAENAAAEIGRVLAESPYHQLTDDIREKRHRLAEYVRMELDPTFLLADLIEQHGVAYHHADLPPNVRTRIEQGVNEGYLQAIAATTTLAEGVNLPISTVLFHSVSRRLARRDFWNIAGRAGRANYNTEGHVVVIKPKNWSRKRVLDRLDPGRLPSVYTIVVGMMQNLWKQLQQRGVDPVVSLGDPAYLFLGDEQVDRYQSFLLSELMEEDFEGTGEEIEQLVEQLLIAYQINRNTPLYRGFVNFTRNHIRYLQQQAISDEFKRVAKQTGLSLSSCLKLQEGIRQFVHDAPEALLSLRAFDDDSDRLDELTPLDKSVLIRLFDIALAVRECKPVGDIKHSQILFDWISGGHELRDLAADHFAGVAEDRRLAACSNYIHSQLSYKAPWALHSLVSILKHYLAHGEDVPVVEGMEFQSLAEWLDGEYGFLSSYASYGVSNPIAAFFCTLGLNRRVGQVLSETFLVAEGVGAKFAWDRAQTWLIGQSEANLERQFDNAVLI